jgi:hypothetical protein
MTRDAFYNDVNMHHGSAPYLVLLLPCYALMTDVQSQRQGEMQNLTPGNKIKMS